ncbi:MAG: hypothetical protein M1816_001582 [Peltula sp. TS41687]|nr:MAG: hypothetical protein M1816_001582 [Peltula sp. TS41687]
MTESRFVRDWTIVCCLYTVATITTILRLFTRACILRQVGTDDYLILAASVIGTVLIPFHYDLLDAFVHFRRLWQNTIALSNQLYTFPILYRRIMRGEYIGGSLYIAEFGLIKLALLAFFLRFMPLGHTRHAVYVVATVVGLFTLATTLVSKPKSIPERRGFLIIIYVLAHIRRLDQLAIGGYWRRYNHSLASADRYQVKSQQVAERYAQWQAHLLSQNPPELVWPDSDSSIVGLSVMFSIGILVTMATAYRLSISIQTNVTPAVNFSRSVQLDSLMLWSQVEINLGILCANIPGLAALWTTLRVRGKAPHNPAAAASRPVPSRRLVCSATSRVQQPNGVTRAFVESTWPPPRKILRPSDDNSLDDYHNVIRSTELDLRIDDDSGRIEEV